MVFKTGDLDAQDRRKYSGKLGKYVNVKGEREGREVGRKGEGGPLPAPETPLYVNMFTVQPQLVSRATTDTGRVRNTGEEDVCMMSLPSEENYMSMPWHSKTNISQKHGKYPACLLYARNQH